jgi:DNA-binding transcriptional LysR family regulator
LRLVLPASWVPPTTGSAAGAADAPAGAPADAPAEVPPAALADVPWVCGGPGVPSRVCLELTARELGLRPRVDHETADYALTLALVRSGLGVALVPDSVLATGHPGGPGGTPDGVAVRHLAGVRPAREICVVHRQRPPAPLRRLIDLIVEAAAEVAARRSP